jgi:hypothetical protein
MRENKLSKETVRRFTGIWEQFRQGDEQNIMESDCHFTSGIVGLEHRVAEIKIGEA